MPPAYAAEFEFAIDVASEAAIAVRRFYDDQTAITYIKDDASPVTDADLASDRIIRERLARSYPNDAVLTEEGVDDEARLSADRVWIADPLDGTQQFVDRTGQFDVLLALVVDGRPVVAVAVQPPTGLVLAAAHGHGVVAGTVGGNTVPLSLAQPSNETRWGSTIWLGAPETGPYLDRLGQRAALGQPIITRTGVFARSYVDPAALSAVAPGAEVASPPEAPLHAFVGLPLKGDGTMAWEWDFITADLIVNEAGGRFTDARGRLHRYNKPMPRNQGGLISANTPELHARIVAAAGPEMDAIEELHRKK